MITHIKGDMFNYSFDCYVNTVNTQGVMGAGLALEFKNRFPTMFQTYKQRCLNNEVQIGKLDIHQMETFCIVNFPTKREWKNPSQYEYIEQGLDALVVWLDTARPKSIVIPPLGCSLGKLSKPVVLSMITNKLYDISFTEIFVINFLY